MKVLDQSYPRTLNPPSLSGSTSLATRGLISFGGAFATAVVFLCAHHPERLGVHFLKHELFGQVLYIGNGQVLYGLQDTVPLCDLSLRGPVRLQQGAGCGAGEPRRDSFGTGTGAESGLWAGNSCKGCLVSYKAIIQEIITFYAW